MWGRNCGSRMQAMGHVAAGEGGPTVTLAMNPSPWIPHHGLI